MLSSSGYLESIMLLDCSSTRQPLKICLFSSSAVVAHWKHVVYNRWDIYKLIQHGGVWVHTMWSDLMKVDWSRWPMLLKADFPKCTFRDDQVELTLEITYFCSSGTFDIILHILDSTIHRNYPEYGVFSFCLTINLKTLLQWFQVSL